MIHNAYDAMYELELILKEDSVCEKLMSRINQSQQLPQLICWFFAKKNTLFDFSKTIRK